MHSNFSVESSSLNARHLDCIVFTEKNGNRDTITVLFSYIRLRRVILLRSYIWLAPSYIALRAVLEANII